MRDSSSAFRRHGEKLFAAAGVAFLLGGAAAAALSIGADDELLRSRAVSDRLGGGLATAPPPARSPHSDSSVRLHLHPPTPPAGTWQMLRRPEFVPHEIPVPPPPGPEGIVRRVRMIPVRDEIGSIVLEWTDDPETNVTLAGYIVERRDPEGRWAVAKETAAGERTYRDATVAPRRTYAWRVTPRIADARCPDVKQGPVSDPVEVTTGSDLKILFKTVNGPIIVVEVRKHQYEIWHSKDFYLRAGETIGEPRRVNVSGTYREVDFTAGRMLGIREERAERTETTDVPVYNAQGQKTGTQQVTRKIPYVKTIMTFEDRESRRVELEKGREY